MTISRFAPLCLEYVVFPAHEHDRGRAWLHGTFCDTLLLSGYVHRKRVEVGYQGVVGDGGDSLPSRKIVKSNSLECPRDGKVGE